MVDKCNRNEVYPNGLELTVEDAIKGGDFQLEDFGACKGCALECQKRINDYGKYGMKY